MSDEVKKPDERERERVHMVFIGHGLSTAKKKIQVWQRIEVGENDGSPLKRNPDKESSFEGKGIYKHATPGSIITIDQTLDAKSVYPSTSRYHTVWSNRDDVARWQAHQRVIEIAEEGKRKAIKDAKASLPREDLAPFRKAYFSLRTTRDRTNYLAWIIQELTDPNIQKEVKDDDD